MKDPKVSFVVPCYNLAHYLAECVNAILSQRFGDLEVLIMDDCSPDNTSEVAQSFRDPRVRHIRNEPNLGHLRNYNKGIELARGQYVWVISADDFLRHDRALERYVTIFETRPSIGYVFSPLHVIHEGNISISANEFPKDPSIWPRYNHGDKDAIFNGREFALKLCDWNRVSPPSFVTRREVFQKHGMFPLDMPQMGDWYLACRFALHYDVGYIGEALVNYRLHGTNMNFKQSRGRVEMFDLLLLHWRVRQEALDVGDTAIAALYENWLVEDISQRLFEVNTNASRPGLTEEEFEKSLCENVRDTADRARVRKRIHEAAANVFSHGANTLYNKGERTTAKHCYRIALHYSPFRVKIVAKWLLLSLGLRW